MHEVKKVGLHGTKNTFGAAKNPDLSRVSSMLHSCPNLESLNISYVARHSPGHFNPVADDFLLCGRWSALRSLTLTNLWCTPHAGLDAAASFLSAHSSLEVLHLDVSFGTGTIAAAVLSSFKFPSDCLPRLRELKASRDLASALLACPGTRPLETLKGIRLSGSARDRVFLENLRTYGAQGIKRLELVGWNEMEDVRRLAECVPRSVWLDLGKRGGLVHAGAASGSASKPASAVVSNSVSVFPSGACLRLMRCNDTGRVGEHLGSDARAYDIPRDPVLLRGRVHGQQCAVCPGPVALGPQPCAEERRGLVGAGVKVPPEAASPGPLGRCVWAGHRPHQRCGAGAVRG